MTHTPTQERDWENKFDVAFGYVLNGNAYFTSDGIERAIKTFIRETLKQDRAYLAGEGKKLLEGCYGSNWADGCAYGIKSMLAIINQ